MASHLADVEVKGWLIGKTRDGRKLFACASESGFAWTADERHAIWFASRHSAEQVAEILGDDAEEIREHAIVLRCELRDATH